jgi:hypothetical protein
VKRITVSGLLLLMLAGCFGGAKECIIRVTPKEISTKVDSNVCTVIEVPHGVIVTQKKN